MVTVTLYVSGALLGFYNGSYIYDELGHYLSTMNFVAPTIALILAIKGLLAPSTANYGSSGNILFDYYWGTELNPRLFNTIDLKHLFVGRCGVTFWALILISCLFKQQEIYHTISGPPLSTSYVI